jgi:hypothetical protein
MDENDGNLANMLCGILKECGCETRIPFKRYAYCEGRVFHKYRGRNHASCQVGLELGCVGTRGTHYEYGL